MGDFISNLVPKCATNCAYVVNMADSNGNQASKAEQSSSEGVMYYMILLCMWYLSVTSSPCLSVFFHTSALSIFIYPIPLSLSSISSPSFLSFSLSIRKHSGLMVGLKLRYKVIRQSMHFWLQCAFTPCPRAHKDSSNLYRSYVVLQVTLDKPFVRDRTSILLLKLKTSEGKCCLFYSRLLYC